MNYEDWKLENPPPSPSRWQRVVGFGRGADRRPAKGGIVTVMGPHTDSRNTSWSETCEGTGFTHRIKGMRQEYRDCQGCKECVSPIALCDGSGMIRSEETVHGTTFQVSKRCPGCCECGITFKRGIK